MQEGPGPARTPNRQILNRTCIEKYTDFDGRRIREFCPSRTRPDSVRFRVLGGIDFGVVIVVDCLVLRLGMTRSVASPLVRNCWHEILIRIVLARDLLQEIC